MMYDSQNFNSHWNVTYYDYSAQIISPEELNGYGNCEINVLFTFSLIIVLY